MIAGRDSSFTVPSDVQLAVAYAAGVRVWGGYLVSDPDSAILSFRSRRQGMYGLAAPWTSAEFDRVRRAGMAAIGFCSGRDSAAGIRARAQTLGVRACVDAEVGIRADGEGGNWIPGWVRDAGAGLYGLASVHHHTGEPLGRGAAFSIVARYPGGDPRATWDPAAGPRPPGLCGWQWRGTTSEFGGVSTDSLWLDDGFLIGRLTPAAGGDGMAVVHRADNSGTDMFPVRSDGGVEHWFWAVGTSDPALYGNLGGNLLWGSISCWWQDDGKTLAVVGQAPSGKYWKNVWTNAGWSGWIEMAMSGGVPASSGPSGPSGPSGSHRHVLASGFTGDSVPT